MEWKRAALLAGVVLLAQLLLLFLILLLLRGSGGRGPHAGADSGNSGGNGSSYTAGAGAGEGEEAGDSVARPGTDAEQADRPASPDDEAAKPDARQEDPAEKAKTEGEGGPEAVGKGAGEETPDKPQDAPEETWLVYSQPEVQEGRRSQGAEDGEHRPPVSAGTGDGLSGGGGGRFFNMTVKGDRIVFVVDRSASMRSHDRFEIAKRELDNAIEGLNRHQAFWVIFFDHTHTPMPEEGRGGEVVWVTTTNWRGERERVGIRGGGLVCATTRNKAVYREWVETISPRGGTNPTSALDMAMAVRSDSIYLLSDGNFRSPTPEEIREKNASRGISISTVALGANADPETLRAIADQNNGDFIQIRD